MIDPQTGYPLHDEPERCDGVIVVRLTAAQVKKICIEAAEYDINKAIIRGIETGHELTGHCLLFADGRAEITFQEETQDPTPWCTGCGSMTEKGCDCGLIADNN